MLLRPEHFAAFRINWRDKVENIREIAVELNVGIDSIAFLDDNPVERERVRTAMPEMKVISSPERSSGDLQQHYVTVPSLNAFRSQLKTVNTRVSIMNSKNALNLPGMSDPSRISIGLWNRKFRSSP